MKEFRGLVIRVRVRLVRRVLSRKLVMVVVGVVFVDRSEVGVWR